MKFGKLPRNLWWYDTGLVVSTFRIYHVWLWGEIRSSLPPSNNMSDIWRPGIYVDDDNNPYTGNIPYEVP